MDRGQHEGRLGTDLLRALTGRRGPQVKGNAMGVRSDTSLLHVADLGCGESITVNPSVTHSFTEEG